MTYSVDRPDIQRAFESLSIDVPAGTTPEGFVAIARALMDRYGGADPEQALRNVTVVPVIADGVEAEFIVPREAVTGQRIVYLHGGAWIAGGLKAYRLLGALLAELSGTEILVVDYRLAPEHPFPGPLDDCEKAFVWALDHGPNGPAPAAVSVAGDSAGANLAAALCIKRILAGLTVPRRLALLCGVLDLAPTGYVARNDPLSSGDSLAASVALYVHGRTELTNPLLSPAAAGNEILRQFPPTLVQASADEFLLEASRNFAGKLIDLGNRTVLSVWPSMPHSWHLFVDSLPEARSALQEVAHFFREGAA